MVYFRTKMTLAAVLCFFAVLFEKSVNGIYLETTGLHGSACEYKADSKSKCKPESGLACLDSTCSCPYSTFQYFDDHKKACVSLINGPCLSQDKKTSFSCTDNAKCQEDPLDPTHQKCKCPEGYLESFEGKCDIAYGFPCDTGKSICDRLGQLVCTQEGKCGCQNDYHVWNQTEQKCVGGVGSICNFVDHGYCQGGAECKATRDANSLTGICTCPQGQKWDGKNCAK